MSETVEVIVLAVFVVATSVWIGGYCAIVVVARSATETLDGPARVEFFRSLGRKYFWVGTPALIIALATGALLARDVAKDGLYLAAVVVGCTLLIAFAVAVAQARRMTRLRQALVATPTDATIQSDVARGARAAGLLRALLGVLSLGLVVLGALLAVA